jgi:hypothetical protein
VEFRYLIAAVGILQVTSCQELLVMRRKLGIRNFTNVENINTLLY